jgi:hypothetical protein
LTTNIWTDLDVPVYHTGSTNCVYDTVIPGQPQRYYQLCGLPLPPGNLRIGNCILAPLLPVRACFTFSWTPDSHNPSGTYYEYESSLVSTNCWIEPWLCPGVHGQTTNDSVSIVTDNSHASPAWFSVRAIDPNGFTSDWNTIYFSW